jgi:cyclopropane fatty-acyl-phospholipid synthase-like methyltransferase
MKSIVKAFKSTALYRFLFGHKKIHFITGLKNGAAVLDVGCGNHSPSIYKRLNPAIQYYGVDIAEYKMNEDDYKAAARIWFIDRKTFASSIRKLDMKFDAVVSAHNLEHTDDPFDVIKAMLFSLKKGGQLYLSFPTEKSAHFPKRIGTLNFYDDPTHNYLPNFKKVCASIVENGGKIIYSRRRYRAPYGFLKGVIQEPASWITGKNYSSTWNFWGFESVIVAEKAD